MFRRAALAVLVLTACRIQGGKWQGSPPRGSGAVRIALYADDQRVRAAVHGAWRRDPKLEITTVDPVDVPGACDGPDQRCRVSLTAGCEWARGHAHDFYAEASMHSGFTGEWVCTSYHDPDGFTGKGHEECTDGYYKNEGASASFRVATYDTHDCHEVSSASAQLAAWQPGNGDEVRTAAEAEVLAETQVALPTFPDQVTVDATGRITGDEGGFYAVFRDHAYRGTMQVRDPKAPVKMLTCCFTPAPGDKLVKRGRIEQLSLDPSLTFTQLDVRGSQHFAIGIGAHLRYYKMDGGLELSFDTDIVTASAANGDAAPFIGAVGWGLRPASWLRVSAHAGGGLVWGHQQRPTVSMTQTTWGPIGYVGARAIITPGIPWLYLGFEGGYAQSGTLDLIEDMKLRGVVVRFFAALSN